MKMIVGLGNPEKQYEKTRHNTGYMALEWLAAKHKATWQAKSKLTIDQAQIEIEGRTLLLMKPATNYNNSGLSVRKAKDFYNLANEDILVIHDELKLPLGTVRARLKGSDAGNNGIKDIIHHIGEDFNRIRTGIDREGRQQSDIDYVLSNFNKDEAAKLLEVWSIIEKIIAHFTEDQFEPVSYTL